LGGSVSKYPFMIHTVRGRITLESAITSPILVSSRPSWRKIMKKGTASVNGGIILVIISVHSAAEVIRYCL
jgi:hypothetical protein